MDSDNFCSNGVCYPDSKHEDKNDSPTVEYDDLRLAVVNARHKFSNEVEDALNRQVSMELDAFHAYLYLASYFDRDDVSLPGFTAFFQKSSDEELTHAKMFIKYINDRGGRYKQDNIDAIDFPNITPLNSLKIVLGIEKAVNTSLCNMHTLAEEHNDGHLADFLEANFLDEQVKSIRDLAGMISRLQLAGEGYGTYMFDQEMLKN